MLIQIVGTAIILISSQISLKADATNLLLLQNADSKDESLTCFIKICCILCIRYHSRKMFFVTYFNFNGNWNWFLGIRDLLWKYQFDNSNKGYWALFFFTNEDSDNWSLVTIIMNGFSSVCMYMQNDKFFSEGWVFFLQWQEEQCLTRGFVSQLLPEYFHNSKDSTSCKTKKPKYGKTSKCQPKQIVGWC